MIAGTVGSSADNVPIEESRHYKDVHPTRNSVRGGFVYNADTEENDPFASPYFRTDPESPRIEDFFGLFMNPNREEMAAIPPSEPFQRDWLGDWPSSTEIDSEELPSPQDAMTPLPAPCEMQSGMDKSGKESLGPRTDPEAVVEAASETTLPESGSAPPADLNPYTNIVLSKVNGEKVAEMLCENVKAFLSTVDGFLKPHMQKKLRVRLESGGPAVYYVMIVSAAGILALVVVLLILTVRPREVSIGEPVGNGTGSELLGLAPDPHGVAPLRAL